ncbi:MAG: GNAT family N-acetyltransferase [Nocardioidaceae bacterium]
MRFPEDVPVLTDGSVTLRAHRREDVPAVLEQCLDPLTQRWTTVPLPYTRADAEQFVGEVVPTGWERGSCWAFAVETVDDDGRPRFCGTVELRDEGNRRAEIAYGAHPWARGRGVMARALSLLLDWGFGEQRLRTVIWWAFAGNWASRRVAWRLGFRFEGRVARWLPQRGDLVDGWVGALHVDDQRTPRTAWPIIPTLGGDPVRLREVREDDLPRIVEACRDERTQYWLGQLPRPFTAEHARGWLQETAAQQAAGTALTWAMADPATDLLLGCVNAFGIKPGREGEIGYWTHPDSRGRGLMTEACALVVDHCLSPAAAGGLGLRRVTGYVAERNLASQHVFEVCGFTRVGRARQALLLGDGWLADAVAYDLLAGERAPGRPR